MASNWQSYIPDYIVAQLVETPDLNLLGRAQRFDAVVLFADVSGFTAISEALGKSGRSGTEELTTILNRYFEPMIALIRSFGGIIGKFGGDAMTVLFPFTVENRAQVVSQAVQCALDMQARMTDYKAIPTSAGIFELAMKAGLAAGSLFATVVGDPDVRLEYIIAGTALDLCAEAEHHATRGEVVVHDALLDMSGEIEVCETREAFRLVNALRTRPPAATLIEPGELAENAIRTISVFLHPTISERVREELTSFINEHRKVTVLFVRFESLDYDRDSQVGETLQGYFSKVVEIIHSYDGYLNKIDMGDKGSKYIVVFGAPIAHEDDVERALQCALDLQEIEGFPVRIGINSGFVYCGLVGSPLRQEYTVMGDVVNLSARLMQASKPGQILIGAETYVGGDGFTWISHPAIQVKGKSEPIAIHELKGKKSRQTIRLQEPQYNLPMVGRVDELRLAQRVIRRVLEGRGQILGITAEAGMGKSRLSVEIIRQALKSGLSGYGGECVSHGTKTSYLVWQNILRGFFGLEEQETVEEQIAYLQQYLSWLNPEIVFRAPLLRDAVNLPIPHNEITQAMDARIRKGSLENLIVDCLRFQAETTPLLFVLEDCHWIDPLSNDLLEVVARNIADLPVLILVIYRPPEEGNIQPRVQQFSHFTEIALEEFTPEEATQLIEIKLAQFFQEVEVPQAFIQRIIEQAGGNPFFVDEMINLIHDRGINPADAQALETITLPDSLNSLIISRIDQLSEGPKTTLKVASVIGRLFRASWLWGIYPQLGSSEQVKAQLDHLDRLEITPLDKPEPELEYLFKHILTREVAYESLAVATRQMLHEQIGHYIEGHYPNEVEQFLSVLAYHFGASLNPEKQREYFYKAGNAAQQSFANEAAMDYYRRLLPLVPDDQKVEIMLRLGDVLQLVGNWDETEVLFREAISMAEKNANRQDFARAHRALGDILSRKGAYAEALEALTLSQTIFEELEDLSGLDFTLRLIGVIHWRQSDHDAALRCFEKCRQVSEQIGNLKGAFRATGNIGLIYKTRADYPAALEAYEKSQKMAHEIGDRVGETTIIMNMGNVYLEIGDYSEALTRYYRSLQIAQEIGDRQGVGLVIGNIGNIYWYTGDFVSMLACQAMHLQTSLELGELWGVSFSANKMALAYMQLGKFYEADAMLSRAIILGKAIESLYELSGFYFDRGNLLNALGKPEEALDVYGEAIQLAAEVDNVVVQFEAQISRLRTQVDLGLKDTQTAIAQLHHLRDTWMEHFHANEEQEAPIHYEIWKLDPTDDFHRTRAAELYAHLYEHTPSSEFRSRYEELTGDHLPDPPPLPPLPDIVTRKPINLALLLEQIDALIQEAQAHSGHHHP
ncbi:MAG TPA: tetratricopeptide repeat protein [Anaerolineales bacterium]|nr:tetratricopeptide repeat protein [Anaerolineales bacterium]